MKGFSEVETRHQLYSKKSSPASVVLQLARIQERFHSFNCEEYKGTSYKKNRFLSAIAQISSPPPPPIRASCTTFLGRQKRRLAHITKPNNDDYDNDVSDNCDNNFGTFGVKNDQKVSHNMILMSKYKGQPGEKKGQKIRARPSPPPFRAMPERNRFFLWEVFP